MRSTLFRKVDTFRKANITLGDEYSYNYELSNRQIITSRSQWKEHFVLNVDHGMTSILFIIIKSSRRTTILIKSLFLNMLLINIFSRLFPLIFNDKT